VALPFLLVCGSTVPTGRGNFRCSPTQGGEPTAGSTNEPTVVCMSTSAARKLLRRLMGFWGGRAVARPSPPGLWRAATLCGIVHSPVAQKKPQTSKASLGYPCRITHLSTAQKDCGVAGVAPRGGTSSPHPWGIASGGTSRVGLAPLEQISARSVPHRQPFGRAQSAGHRHYSSHRTQCPHIQEPCESWGKWEGWDALASQLPARHSRLDRYRPRPSSPAPAGNPCG